MALIQLLRRGAAETIASQLTGANGVQFSIPVDASNARAAFQFTYGGSPATVSVPVQATLDGSNWFALYTSTNANGEIAIVICTAVLGIRVGQPTFTGGASPNVTVIVRFQ